LTVHLTNNTWIRLRHSSTFGSGEERVYMLVLPIRFHLEHFAIFHAHVPTLYMCDQRRLGLPQKHKIFLKHLWFCYTLRVFRCKLQDCTVSIILVQIAYI